MDPIPTIHRSARSRPIRDRSSENRKTRPTSPAGPPAGPIPRRRTAPHFLRPRPARQQVPPRRLRTTRRRSPSRTRASSRTVSSASWSSDLRSTISVAHPRSALSGIATQLPLIPSGSREVPRRVPGAALDTEGAASASSTQGDSDGNGATRVRNVRPAAITVRWGELSADIVSSRRLSPICAGTPGSGIRTLVLPETSVPRGTRAVSHVSR